MKKVMLLAIFVLAVAGLMMAQNWSSPGVDVLGAHNNQGRGCAGCHAPHSGSFGSGHGGAADAGVPRCQTGREAFDGAAAVRGQGDQ